MKPIKFVTAFYPYHSRQDNAPFWGQHGREDRYLYSCKTFCNMGERIVCYTDADDLGYNQLTEFKTLHGLHNLEIKVFPLINNPYQERVYKIRTENAEFYDNHEVGNYRRSPQIYWMKFEFLLKEYEPDINLYWIDMGLACEGLFPPYANPYGHEEHYSTWYRYSGEAYKDYKHKFYTFPGAFNPATVKRITDFTEDKFVNIYRHQVTDCNHASFKRVTNEHIEYDGVFVVGGFFGGNSNYVPELVAEARRCIELILQDNYYLCGDEEILTHLRAKYKDYHKVWMCHTFYHEGRPDIWNESMIPFHRFFTGQ